MTEYIIESNDFHASITEESGFVTAASSQFDLCVGLPFSHVRDYCTKKGWFVIPVIPGEDDHRPTILVINHKEYTLKWVGDVLVRITLHEGFGSRDLSFDELPESLKNLL